MPSYIHTVLRSLEDWERARSGDPAIWSYDQDGKLAVPADVFAARAGPNIWTPTGKWDNPPITYPSRAVRELADEPPPQSTDPEPEAEKAPAVRHRRRSRAALRPGVRKSYLLPVEAPEKLDYLCEAYRMDPSQVIARLIDEAYRRDVVESGLLAMLGDDFGIIAPKP